MSASARPRATRKQGRRRPDGIDRDEVQAQLARFGRRIAGARVERSLSQADVAAIAETSAPRISAIENATQSTRADLLIRVASVVGLELTLSPKSANPTP